MFLMIVLFLLAPAEPEMHSVNHQMYITRRSRSNSAPYESGYVYNQIDNDPGTLSRFGGDNSDYSIYSSGVPSKRHSDYKSDYHNSISTMDKYSDSTVTNYGDNPKYKYESYKSNPLYATIAPNTGSLVYPTGITMPYTTLPMSKYDLDYEISKSKSRAEYESGYIPSKIKADAMYERLKSLMHYSPSAEEMSEMMKGYDYHHIDDDDVRTTSRNVYDSWPYFHSPYEYEYMNSDYEIEKAKDKRNALDSVRTTIPVHENVEEVLRAPYIVTGQGITSTENPIADNGFFSYALNDYFDKKDEEDPLVFKGLEWGKDYEHGPIVSSNDGDILGKKNIRLETVKHQYIPASSIISDIKTNGDKDYSKESYGNSATEKGYTKDHRFDKQEKGEEEKDQHANAYEKGGQNYNGFKTFVDTFTNKYGSEDNKKDGKYSLKMNQDKGEKKKGFRRVYHKDEYSEDNEFFDNINKNANSEESGSTNSHAGGSHALLHSDAGASLGNEANAFRKTGNSDKNSFKKGHEGHSSSKGLDSEFERFRNVAQLASANKDADYSDRYRN